MLCDWRSLSGTINTCSPADRVIALVGRRSTTLRRARVVFQILVVCDSHDRPTPQFARPALTGCVDSRSVLAFPAPPACRFRLLTRCFTVVLFSALSAVFFRSASLAGFWLVFSASSHGAAHSSRRGYLAEPVSAGFGHRGRSMAGARDKQAVAWPLLQQGRPAGTAFGSSSYFMGFPFKVFERWQSSESLIKTSTAPACRFPAAPGLPVLDLQRLARGIC